MVHLLLEPIASFLAISVQQVFQHFLLQVQKLGRLDQ